jgi:predicted SAM-dependent methyltransferase
MISRGSRLYKIMRWAYQPAKHAFMLVREWSSLRGRTQIVANYLKQTGFKGLQVGCGPHCHYGWMNTDTVGTPEIDFPLDIEKSLPFPNGALDAIYGSEVIEHIPREKVRPFLQEAYRVLRPGGVLRLTTPDLKAICRIYLGSHDKTTLDEHKTTWTEPEFSPHYWINATFRNWGHQWIWDFESLAELLNSVGFKQVECVSPQITNSGMSQLGTLETRYDVHGVPAPKHCWTSSMILEATR